MNPEDAAALGCFLELLTPALLAVIAYLLYLIAVHMGAV